MDEFSKEELDRALHVILSTIRRCEKMQPKFLEGTSQHSLLKNRIKSLYISQSLISADGTITGYTKDDLKKALPPVTSIISKTEKAQSKYEKESASYKRFESLIHAMYISKSMIENELLQRE